MKILQLSNATRGGEIASHCVLANNFWTRGKGLLGRSDLPTGEAILLVPGASIHMFGMKFSIDALFLTSDDIVTDIVENLAPGKMHVAKAGAGKPFATLELPAGTVARLGVQIGDQIERKEI
ncbi:MAG TPA: DUF192 domain-containing protein [Abditibacterium sp.]|jgi:hypothetical protein